jgi:hypothetical protein
MKKVAIAGIVLAILAVAAVVVLLVNQTQAAPEMASVRMANEQIPAPFVYGIYKACVNVNLTIDNGDELHVVFLAYDNVTVESDVVIWRRTASGPQTVTFSNLVVPHDNMLVGLGHPSAYVKRVKLVLENRDGTVVWNDIAWYKVVQADWRARENRIASAAEWPLYTPAQQDQINDEAETIVLYWLNTPAQGLSAIPEGPRDQHDFKGG